MRALAGALLLVLAGCASAPEVPTAPETAPQSAEPTSKGGYYKDDGPGEQPPSDLASIPDAQPKAEPLHRFANRPYQVLGKDYVPLAALSPYRERGVASWYGRRFHGQRTSSGERYDMYAMSAAHRTLPIPTYARVTNLVNGRSVIVRINDRGPFHANRLIDLSYAAAYRLGFIGAGSAQVEVEAIVPGEPQDPVAVYVQLGAFSSRENAESFREQLAAQLAWVTETMQVMLSGQLWRLHLGPYRSSEEARAVAARIESEVSLKPLLVVR